MLLLLACAPLTLSPAPDPTTLDAEFDQCAPQVGEDAPARELAARSHGETPAGATGEVVVFSDQASLDLWWLAGTHSAAPELDFTRRQAVGFVDRVECGGGGVDAFAWSAREEGTLVARVREDCGHPCDEGGGYLWQVWGTPIAPVVTCDFGDICP